MKQHAIQLTLVQREHFSAYIRLITYGDIIKGSDICPIGRQPVVTVGYTYVLFAVS